MSAPADQVTAGFPMMAPIVSTATYLPNTGSAAIVPSFNLSDWFKPPKLFITLGIAAGVIYVMYRQNKSMSYRKIS